MGPDIRRLLTCLTALEDLKRDDSEALALLLGPVFACATLLLDKQPSFSALFPSFFSKKVLLSNPLEGEEGQVVVGLFGFL